MSCFGVSVSVNLEILVVVTWGLNCSQSIISNSCFSSALSPPHYICSTENLFHFVREFMSYLHGHCSFHFIANTTVSNRKPSLQHWDKLKQTLLCVRSLVRSRLWGHFPTAGHWIWLSLLIWSRKHHSEIILPPQFVRGMLLVFAVDSKPYADQ